MGNAIYATSALALAGAVAAGPASAADMLSVGVGGYMEQWFGMSSTDAKGKAGKAMEVNDGSAQHSDSEIHFKGKMESDSGLTFSVKIELEGNNQSTGKDYPGSNAAAIDESQLTVGGAFGAVTLGAEDGASVLSHHNVKSAGAVGLNCGDVGAWIQGVNGCGGGLETSGHQHGDKNNITYFSPRVGGFQFGATYIPDAAQEFGTIKDGTNNDRNAWSVGGNFVGEFGGTNLSVSLGHYQRSQTSMSAMIFDGMKMNDADKIKDGGPARVPVDMTVAMLKDEEDTVTAYKKALADVMGGKALVGEEKATDAKGAQNTLDMYQVSRMVKADDRTFTNVGLNVGFGSFTFGVAYAKSDGGAYKVMDMNRLMLGPEFTSTFGKDGALPDGLAYNNGVVTDKRSGVDEAELTNGSAIGNDFSIVVDPATGDVLSDVELTDAYALPTGAPDGAVIVIEGESYDTAPGEEGGEVTHNSTANDNPMVRMQEVVKDMSKDYDVISTSAMFTDGPMSVSLGYIMADYDNGDEHSLAELGVSYVMAPGVAWKSSIFAAEADNADGSMRDGTGFVTGFAIGF